MKKFLLMVLLAAPLPGAEAGHQSHGPAMGATRAELGASAAFESLSFHTAYKEYRNVVRGRDVRLWRFLKLSKDPNVFATLLEDGAALVPGAA